MKKLSFKTLKNFKVTRRLVTVMIVLFLISLVGFFATRGLPSEVQGETPLLNYTHNGNFDYTVYLKPSYLFGPPPVTEKQPEKPETLKYPCELIDRVGFTFEYKTEEGRTARAWVEAVLENPGIWEKKIVVAPETEISGEYFAHFYVNPALFNELFDEAEEVVKISQGERQVSIRAYISPSLQEQYVYSLPIKLTDTLMEVDTNLRQTQSAGVGTFHYVVYWVPNNIFEWASSEPPLPSEPPPPPTTTLNPGEVIFARLVDSMDVTFAYHLKSEKPVEKVNTDVDINLALEAPELWSKKFPILHDRGEADFTISFPVDMLSYLDLLTAIGTETGVSAESYNLTITADVHTTGETEFGLLDDTFSQSLKGTIKGNILEWDKELSVSTPGAIKTSQVVPNPKRYLGLSVGGVKNLTAALAGVFGFLFAVSVALYFMFKPAKVPKVEKEAQRAKKRYGELIVEATSQTPIEMIRTIHLSSMEDLIKLADELGKPIIHQSPATAEGEHAYYVLDGFTRYQYILTPSKD